MAVSIKEDFISSFHSLEGLTIGERHKNLFLLLNKTQQALKDTAEEIDFSLLKPKNPLEENFKINVLIYFKRTSELFEVLKSEHPVLIHKILNAGSWFIEEAFGTADAVAVVTKVFPYYSYNTKLKLINKLSLQLKDPQKVDDYFEAIREIYGLYLASKLLAGCSDKLIMKCIQSNRVEITSAQLLIIIKRYPNLTEEICDVLKQYNYKIDFSEKYKKVFHYLLRHDVALFLKLRKIYNPCLQLGSRATDNLIRNEKESFMEDPKKYFDFLKVSRIGYNLKEDFSKVYIKLFPKSLNQLRYRLSDQLSLLGYLRSNSEKLKMLSTTFTAVHGNNIWDHPKFVTTDLIKLMSSDDRETWMQSYSRPDDISDEEWIMLMKPEKSIPLLKEKIALTSNLKQREKLVAALVRTCAINEDNLALLEVCKYMSSKHHNDNANIRKEFLRVIYDSFDLLKLDDKVWEHITEFTTLGRLNGEPFSWLYKDIHKTLIHRCLKNDAPIKDYLLEWIKMKDGSYTFCTKVPKYEKQCLLLVNDILLSTYKEDLQYGYVEFLNSIMSYNKRNPKDRLSLFINSAAIDYIKLNLKKSNYYSYPESRIASACITSNYLKSEEAGLIKVFFSWAGSFIERVSNWLVKKQPLIFDKYMKLLLEKQGDYMSSCYLYKYYTHLDIPQHHSEMCLDIIYNEKEQFRSVKNATLHLSHVMDSNEFIKFVASYYPSGLSIDIKTENGQYNHQLLQRILPCLKNVVPPSLALESILQFCKGDYLKMIQGSLYSVSKNAAENKLGNFFNVLSERAVSVRKHAVFLSFKFLNRADVYKLLVKLMGTEKNSSSRKSMFKGIFNYFIINNDDYSWELAKSSINALNVNDSEAFNILTKCRRIPQKYFLNYTLHVWAVLERFENPSEVIEQGKGRLLDSISSKNILILPEEFCLTIIEKYFLKSKDLSDFQKKIQAFVSKYIIFYTTLSEEHERFNFTFEILNNCIKTSWNDLNTTKVARLMVSKFVEEFCSYFIQKNCVDKDILRRFIVLWDEQIQSYMAFDEYLYLYFTSIYLDCLTEKSTIPEIGVKLVLLSDTLYNQGILVKSNFCDTYNAFKNMLLTIELEKDDKDENEILLIDTIIKTGKPSCLILAVYLFSTGIYTDNLMSEKANSMYNTILDSLMKATDPVVQIHLHQFLSDRIFPTIY